MWTQQNERLEARFRFPDFVQAWAFMTEVAFVAEQQQHHPNWSNVYNTVDIALCTHDAGNIVTEKDHRLAEAISAIYARYAGR